MATQTAWRMRGDVHVARLTSRQARACDVRVVGQERPTAPRRRKSSIEQ